MKCFNCQEEINPTLVYCAHCGAPLDTDIEDIRADEERKQREKHELEGKQWAQGIFVLALFWLGCVIAARVVLLDEQRYDAFVGFRVPAEVVEEQAPAPPTTVEVDTLSIPLPTE